MGISPDLLETVTPATAGAARRLTTAANVRALIGSPSGDDTLLETLIDRISASAARYCNLAVDSVGTLPTFGAETLRATWYAGCGSRSSALYLPWRQPFTAITSVVEDGETLVGNTDYRLLSQGGRIGRLEDGLYAGWSCEEIVITFTCGWSLPTGVPPDLEAAVIGQASMVYQGRVRDPSIRSEDAPGLGQVAYSVPGGDTIGASGLLPQVESALDTYLAMAIA